MSFCEILKRNISSLDEMEKTSMMYYLQCYVYTKHVQEMSRGLDQNHR